MSKRCFRFFGGLLVRQERWLNRMAERGYRLAGTGKLTYDFEECPPGAHEYRVEFVGGKSAGDVERYVRFLEDCGYRVFVKNINLNWSVGKVQVRPWAEPGGRLATNRTTLNRELLIVEKLRDGRPFELRTTNADRLAYVRSMRRPWLWLLAASAALSLCVRSWVWAIFAVLGLAGTLAYSLEAHRLKRRARIEE